MQGHQKSEMHQMTQTGIEHLQSKLLYPHCILTLDTQILVHFTLRPAVFKIQGRGKSELHRMTTNGT